MRKGKLNVKVKNKKTKPTFSYLVARISGNYAFWADHPTLRFIFFNWPVVVVYKCLFISLADYEFNDLL